jgi:hypothetical protein
MRRTNETGIVDTSASWAGHLADLQEQLLDELETARQAVDKATATRIIRGARETNRAIVRMLRGVGRQYVAVWAETGFVDTADRD